jgi:hypothetical protein
MLTKESNEFIKELKPKMKSKDLLESNHLKKLFHILESNTFEYDVPTITKTKGNYSCGGYMTKRLMNKAKKYNHITSLKWSLKSKYSVNCVLNIHGLTEKGLNEKSINLLVYALSFICSLSDRSRTIIVHYVPLKDKKNYTGKFTRNEINSGSCSSSDSKAEICLWREEECIKVLFHECIHGLKFSSIQDSDKIIEKYNRLYNNNSPKMLIEETYTEVWAKILNCYFVARLSAFHHEDLDCYKYFGSLLAIEREFCLLQGHKVSKDLKDNHKRDINKDTNVIAYYIGTAEVFNNLNNFLSFCFRDKKPFYLKDQRLFISFLMGCKKVPIRKLNRKSKSYATLRMTGIELKV